jgi:hypothetical protein
VSRELATHPDWQRGTRTRLLASLAIAGFLIITFILTTDFGADPEPIGEIQVTLRAPDIHETPQLPAEELEPLQVQEAVRELQPLADIARPSTTAAAPAERAPVSRDWYAAMDEVVAAVVAEEQKTYSVNPAFDAKRRQAAEQFRPSRAPVAKPIWENVETDQLGRKILVSGDCHRVIDDPNVGSQEMFRTFHQFIVFCSKHDRQPQELPWVAEIRDQRAYL